MLIDTGGITAPFDFIDRDKYRKLSDKMSKDLTSLILSWDDEETKPTVNLLFMFIVSCKFICADNHKSNCTEAESSAFFKSVFITTNFPPRFITNIYESA